MRRPPARLLLIVNRPALVAACLAAAAVPLSPCMAEEKPGVAVMIHGAGGGGWEYEFWKPVFERAGWHVICPDLAPAKAGLARTSFTDYLDQVRSWAPKEHGRLVVVGASMGGILAIKAAETLRPDAVVLVDSVAPAGVGVRRQPQTHPAIIPWANGPLKDTRDAMPDSDEATILRAHPRWRDESGAVLDAISKGVSARKPTCSTLVVLGERDTDVPTATGLALARWSGADVHLYHATSHVGPLLGKRAPEIAGAVLRWLDARLGRSAR